MASDGTTLVLSVDYELFFDRSGSVERCLIEPSDALIGAAGSMGARITFFVDAGMLVAMDRFAGKDRRLARMSDQVRRHIAEIATRGHDIELHVHPHWQDTAWRNGQWHFANTRYQLRDFPDDEIQGMFQSYCECLAGLSGRQPIAYRAGGFCVEPFDKVAVGLAKTGINVDSSVVPGASLTDADKGFDFRNTPQGDWWEFSESPLVAEQGGRYLEVPVTTQRLPMAFYWGRLFGRLRAERKSAYFGDGTSKSISKTEILRRLAGASRTAELSIDTPKAGNLLRNDAHMNSRTFWHLMGHSKLLSHQSLKILKTFVNRQKIQNFETLATLSQRIRNGSRP